MSFDDDEFGGLLDRETVLAGGVPLSLGTLLLGLLLDVSLRSRKPGGDKSKHGWDDQKL